MKIAIGSDIHLEFGSLEIENKEDADVLILSGDIFPVDNISLDILDKRVFHNFMENVSREFKQTVMVMGNHEFYHGNFANAYKELQLSLREYENITLLEKEKITIGNIVFLGATLWTDMNGDDPETINSMMYTMNDYRLIKNGDRRLVPEDTIEAFYETLGFIDRATMDNGKFVMVGHHAPSKQSTHPRYAGDLLMNGAYSSNLFDFIYERPQIKLWTHGHTHMPFDYMINETRIVCNPRGYIGHEALAAKFDLKCVEV